MSAQEKIVMINNHPKMKMIADKIKSQKQFDFEKTQMRNGFVKVSDQAYENQRHFVI